jgi:hypothetical protein
MQYVINLIISFFSKAIGENAQCFWLMAQTLIIFGSLIFIYRQVKIQRFTNMLNMLNSMRENWTGNNMLKSRKAACINYKNRNNKIGKAESDVLGFFEDMGLLLKKKALSEEFIWETYSYFIEHYYTMLEPNIKEFRQSTKDNSWYKNCEELSEKMKKYSKKSKASTYKKTNQKIEQFIKGELEDF